MPSKALLIGLNYLMNKEDMLLSPVNNIEILNDFLISYLGVNSDNIKMLSDSPNYENATFFNITSSLKQIINSSNKKDFIFLYFSGYGNFLGEPEKGSDKAIKKSMKIKTLYKKKNEDILFLPEDYNMSTLTKDYFYKLLNNSNSRIFLFFDCYNKNNMLNLKHYYDINKKTYNTFLGKYEKQWNNNIIVLSSDNMEKKNFSKFNKINIINNKINKYFSIFLLDFIKYLFNYLQININFNTFTYKNMYEMIIEINDTINKLNFSSFNKKENKKMNECGCCNEKKNNVFLLFSDGNLLNTNFFDNESIEKEKEEEINDKIKKKMLLRDKTLAFKNIKLERELKILKKRFNHILNQYETINKKINSNSNLNFKLLL